MGNSLDFLLPAGCGQAILSSEVLTAVVKEDTISVSRGHGQARQRHPNGPPKPVRRRQTPAPLVPQSISLLGLGHKEDLSLGHKELGKETNKNTMEKLQKSVGFFNC